MRLRQRYRFCWAFANGCKDSRLCLVHREQVRIGSSARRLLAMSRALVVSQRVEKAHRQALCLPLRTKGLVAGKSYRIYRYIPRDTGLSMIDAPEVAGCLISTSLILSGPGTGVADHVARCPDPRHHRSDPDASPAGGLEPLATLTGASLYSYEYNDAVAVRRLGSNVPA